MNGIIIVCMLHYNTAWFGLNIHREDVIVNSQVECNKLAIERGHYFAGTGTVTTYDMKREIDKEQLTIRCGVDAKDCKK